MWSGEREKLNSNPVYRNNPLGLVEFVNNDSDFSITCPLAIPPSSMKLAKDKEPFMMLSGLTDKTFEMPMTVASCMEFMNLHMRADKENQLKLRVEMTEEDKLIVRNARDKSVKREAAIVLRQKMEGVDLCLDAFGWVLIAYFLADIIPCIVSGLWLPDRASYGAAPPPTASPDSILLSVTVMTVMLFIGPTIPPLVVNPDQFHMPAELVDQFTYVRQPEVDHTNTRTSTVSAPLTAVRKVLPE
ncbi:hypothetical protein JVT61DRAFT_12264 [Boletus reticuloceps]|uniref:DUF8205 domain-containing protein n=1 Tax=Boletus reticuloceps TaxID=495285 RepID=A0A8I3A4A5_9AGAM|nr:hypothetical protein JVT61DRAFT_12264 [Boletus reticuloceps]